MNCVSSSPALQQRAGTGHRLARLPPCLPPSTHVFGGLGRVTGRSVSCAATEPKGKSGDVFAREGGTRPGPAPPGPSTIPAWVSLHSEWVCLQGSLPKTFLSPPVNP